MGAVAKLTAERLSMVLDGGHTGGVRRRPVDKQVRAALHGHIADARASMGEDALADALADAERSVEAAPAGPAASPLWERKARLHTAMGAPGAALACWERSSQQATAAVGAPTSDGLLQSRWRSAQVASAREDALAAATAALRRLCSAAHGQARAAGPGMSHPLAHSIVSQASMDTVLECVHAAPSPSALLLQAWERYLQHEAFAPGRSGGSKRLSQAAQLAQAISTVDRVAVASQGFMHRAAVPIAAWNAPPSQQAAMRQAVDPRALLEAGVLGMRHCVQRYGRVLRTHFRRREERVRVVVVQAEAQAQLGAALLRRVWGGRGHTPGECRERNVSEAIEWLRRALATISEHRAVAGDLVWAQVCLKLGVGYAARASAGAPDESQIRRLFHEMDTDGSATLDAGEVSELARRLGAPMSKAGLRRAMEKMDFDSSGEVDEDEFISWWRAERTSKLGRLINARWSNEALASFQNALSVFGRDVGRREKTPPRLVYPLQFARVMMEMADVHAMVARQKAVDTVASITRPNSEDGVKVSLHQEEAQRAVHFYRECQRVCTRERYPAQWSRCEFSIGKLLVMRGSSSSNGRAVGCFENVLKTLDRKTHEAAWLDARQSLATVLREKWARLS